MPAEQKKPLPIHKDTMDSIQSPMELAMTRVSLRRGTVKIIEEGPADASS